MDICVILIDPQTGKVCAFNPKNPSMRVFSLERNYAVIKLLNENFEAYGIKIIDMEEGSN